MQSKTTRLQNAIILSSIIGTILGNYDPKNRYDRHKAINTLRRRIAKFMFKRSRSNRKEFVQAIAYADKVWRDAVTHFEKQNLSIEAISTVIRLYDLYADVLSKYANINEKQVEAYAMSATGVSVDIEMTSYKVSDYILELLSDITGVKRVNKLRSFNAS